MAKPGLQDNSQVTEKIEKASASTLKRYRVVEDILDIASLKKERQLLQNQVTMDEPSVAELIALGKNSHPYYQDKTPALARIAEIDDLLAT